MTENIKRYLDHAIKAYYSGHPVISDEVFDALAARYGYNKVGAPAEGKKKLSTLTLCLVSRNTMKTRAYIRWQM